MSRGGGGAAVQYVLRSQFALHRTEECSQLNNEASQPLYGRKHLYGVGQWVRAACLGDRIAGAGSRSEMATKIIIALMQAPCS